MEETGKELNQCSMSVGTIVAGCGKVQITRWDALYLSWDLNSGPDISSVTVWLIRPNGSKEMVNTSDVTLPGGHTLEGLIKSVRDKTEGAKKAEEDLRHSIARLQEAITIKAPPSIKNRDHQQEKYRRRYHGRKK